jgi:hypothetical protein
MNVFKKTWKVCANLFTATDYKTHIYRHIVPFVTHWFFSAPMECMMMFTKEYDN